MTGYADSSNRRRRLTPRLASAAATISRKYVDETARATRVPEPVRDTTYPSLTSYSYADNTVLRDTFSRRNSARVDGRCVPGVMPPATIVRRSDR